MPWKDEQRKRAIEIEDKHFGGTGTAREQRGYEKLFPRAAAEAKKAKEQKS